MDGVRFDYDGAFHDFPSSQEQPVPGGRCSLLRRCSSGFPRAQRRCAKRSFGGIATWFGPAMAGFSSVSRTTPPAGGASLGRNPSCMPSETEGKIRGSTFAKPPCGSEIRSRPCFNGPAFSSSGRPRRPNNGMLARSTKRRIPISARASAASASTGLRRFAVKGLRLYRGLPGERSTLPVSTGVGGSAGVVLPPAVKVETGV